MIVVIFEFLSLLRDLADVNVNADVRAFHLHFATAVYFLREFDIDLKKYIITSTFNFNFNVCAYVLYVWDTRLNLTNLHFNLKINQKSSITLTPPLTMRWPGLTTSIIFIFFGSATLVSPDFPHGWRRSLRGQISKAAIKGLPTSVSTGKCVPAVRPAAPRTYLQCQDQSLETGCKSVIECRWDDQPRRKMKKILFVGNSLTYVNNLPGMVQSLVNLVRNGTVLTKFSGSAGLSFRDHVKRKELVTTLKEGWDAVVLQARTSEPLWWDDSDGFLSQGKILVRLVRKYGAIPYILNSYATCSPEDCNPGDLLADGKVIDHQMALLSRDTKTELLPISHLFAQLRYVQNSDWDSDAPLLFTSDNK